MFCTKCGEKISDDAKFCRSCGAPVTQTAEEKKVVVEEKANIAEKPKIKEEKNSAKEPIVKEERKSETIKAESKKIETSKEEKKTKKSKKPAIVITIILLLIAGIVAFIIFGTRGAKAAVKDYIKAINEENGKKVMAVTDFDGAKVFMEMLANADISDFNDIDDKYLEDFDDIYEEYMEEKKNADEDEKEEYKETMKEMEEYMEEYLKEADIDDMEIVKISQKAVKGSNKLTKVTATLKSNGEKEEQTFYTMKKGLKEYVISPHIAMNIVVTSKEMTSKEQNKYYDNDDDYSYDYDSDDDYSYDYDYDEDEF